MPVDLMLSRETQIVKVVKEPNKGIRLYLSSCEFTPGYFDVSKTQVQGQT